MRVLVVGNGGREDALCKKLSESRKIEKLYCSNGNAGTLRYAENISLKSNEDIKKFAIENMIDLVVVGPEKPLCEGIVDMFSETNIKVFGPNKKSAMLEGSKIFSKKFMEKYDVPTAKSKLAYGKEEAIEFLNEFSFPLVVKADGLCYGKGVKICENIEEAKEYLKELFDDNLFGNEGKKVVIEEYLKGEEASLLCFVSNDKLIAMESARDYKKIFENDKGPNTGGVGCYSPSELFSDDIKIKIDDILNKISKGLKEERLTYNGILFIGFMISKEKINVLEFNVRFGDPETEVVLPRLESDLLDIILKSIDGSIKKEDLKWKKEKALAVILTSKGYPESYEKSKQISGLENLSENIQLFHNGTKKIGENIYTDGGRVLTLVTLGEDFEDMRKIIYENIEKVNFEGKQFRKDIGLNLGLDF